MNNIRFYILFHYLFFPFLFTTCFSVVCEEAPPPEIQAISIDNESPTDELILRFFLKEISKSRDELFRNEKAFQVFLRNFNFNPKRLIKEIPLSYYQNIEKLIHSTLKTLNPIFESLVYEGNDSFLFCKTIRGTRILAITLTPIPISLFEEKSGQLHLTVLNAAQMSQFLLKEPKYLNMIQQNDIFLKLLTADVKKTSNIFAPESQLNSIFMEISNTRGYDVSSICKENTFFSLQQKNQKAFSFLSLPVLQYAENEGNLYDYFFHVTDPVLLQTILDLLQNSKGTDKIKIILNQIESFLQTLKRNRFPQKNFPEHIQNLFTNLDYSINYDAIALDKKEEIYENLLFFLLSNGLESMEELVKNKVMIEKIIEKFFVLGTTYFFRSWGTIREYSKYLDGKKFSETSRPLKFKVFACSSGEEVLTFAFNLLDNGIQNFTILGSDINSQFIETAKQMVYQKENFERLPDDLRNHILKTYFKKNSDGEYELKNKQFFQKRIMYRVMDITKPLPEDLPKDFSPPYDFISCQNIFLYLNPGIVLPVYRKMIQLLDNQGLFILTDKIYSHSYFNKNISNKKILSINEHLIQVFSKNHPDSAILQKLSQINSSNPSFPSIKQFCDMGCASYEEKFQYLNEQIKKPGNHSILTFFAVESLLKMKKYEQASELAIQGIWESPYLLNNYNLLEISEKNKKNYKFAEYIHLISKSLSYLYKSLSTQSLQHALDLFQRALKLIPEQNLGYYSLAYQLIRYSNELRKNNVLPIDYEKFFNQAFRNLNFILKNDPDNVYIRRGIAEIATILSADYSKRQNQEIADRLVYNALVKYETVASKSKDFTVLFTLAKLQLKVAQVYFGYEAYEQAYKALKKALDSFEKAEKSSLNYSTSLLYNFYTEFAEAWVGMYKILNTSQNSMIWKEHSLAESMNNAVKAINMALLYNSVYGVEAIELRNQIFELDDKRKANYLDSFETD